MNPLGIVGRRKRPSAVKKEAGGSGSRQESFLKYMDVSCHLWFQKNWH
jgi:hypothetical protein